MHAWVWDDQAILLLKTLIPRKGELLRSSAASAKQGNAAARTSFASDFATAAVKNAGISVAALVGVITLSVPCFSRQQSAAANNLQLPTICSRHCCRPSTAFRSRRC